MAKEFFTAFQLDEVQYFLDFLKNNIEKYKLSELTNKNCGDVPSINGVHPLALEYGNMLLSGDTENYTSILPAIGVELLDDNESRQLLGNYFNVEELTQSYIDGIDLIPLKDRFEKGYLMSNTVMQSVKDMKTAKGTDKLYSKTNLYIQEQSVAVSIWSQHFDITRILYMVVRSLLKRAKLDLSSNGIKNVIVNGQGAIYNYEFGQTLFGAEFQVLFYNAHKNFEVDDSIIEIKNIDEKIGTPEGINPIPSVTFKPIGG